MRVLQLVLYALPLKMRDRVRASCEGKEQTDANICCVASIPLDRLKECMYSNGIRQ